MKRSELKDAKSGRSSQRSGEITDTFSFQEWN